MKFFVVVVGKYLLSNFNFHWKVIFKSSFLKTCSMLEKNNINIKFIILLYFIVIKWRRIWFNKIKLEIKNTQTGLWNYVKKIKSSSYSKTTLNTKYNVRFDWLILEQVYIKQILSCTIHCYIVWIFDGRINWQIRC